MELLSELYTNMTTEVSESQTPVLRSKFGGVDILITN